MNVSRLPGYSRLEEELEADDLLRSAAIEVFRFFQKLTDSPNIALIAPERINLCYQV